jgi:hypothetical protein
MKQKLELQLVKKYPNILKDYKGDRMVTCMAWGMECDDGWYSILDECMSKLDYFCRLCSTSSNQVDVVARQIKEKYGRLCFYYEVTGADNQQYSIIEDIIDTAERKSEYTCEMSGEMGEPCSKGGWFKTLCYKQSRELGYKACNLSVEEYWKQKDKKPLYSYKHKPTNTWVYFLPNRNVIALCLKPDATTFNNPDELKHKLTTCSFNGVNDYCKNNLLEFEMCELKETNEKTTYE